MTARERYKRGYVRIFIGRDGWYAILRAPNHRTLDVSQSYASRGNAIRASRVHGKPIQVIEQDGTETWTQ